MTLRLAVTSGEPAGIGPDVCLALAQRAWPCQLVVLGDAELLAQRAAQLGVSLQFRVYQPGAAPLTQPAGVVTVLHMPLVAPVTAGQLDPANAQSVIAMIQRAVTGCLTGEFAAMVTAPVHKGILNRGGYAFSGHTEFIAELTGGTPVMMLTAPGLRVALATTHLPLRAVPDAITAERLEAVLTVLQHDLQQRYGIVAPRILVAGLNPHAGEDGYLGGEELDILLPLLQQLRDRGMVLEGPLPADTLFTPPFLARADAVLAMYHDQGLPVLKHYGFGKAVNVTLGLPIIRTSVDHGTAVELAGSGRAEGSSLAAAVTAALELATPIRASSHP